MGQLEKTFKSIIRDLETAVPEIVKLRDEAAKRAEVERERREVARRELERKELERRRAEALQESHQQLLRIVQAWSLARSIESFLADAERRTSELPNDERTAILERLAKARAILGGTDALAHLRRWIAPDDNCLAYFPVKKSF
ncbi:MAG: hypothetical protein ACRD2N_16720 [Vicinamibacterales bacterium]